VERTRSPLVLAVAIGLWLVVSRSAHAADKKSDANLTLLFVGGAQGDVDSPTLVQLRARLAQLAPDDALVVFTGNYMKGELPAEGDDGREEAEQALRAHVDATFDFVKRGGRVYFLAGHHDYPEGGTRAVRRLRQFLNEAYKPAVGDGRGAEDGEIDVMPQAGCADPHLFELRENVGLLLLESQWWTQDLATDPMANEGCTLKNRTSFGAVLKEILNSYRGRRLIIASHLPLRSYGPWAARSPPAPT